MDLEELLTPGNLTLWDLVCYLGPRLNNEQQKAANTRGISFLQHFGIVPFKNTSLLCGICDLPLRGVLDISVAIGYRYMCGNRHKFVPTKNTFLEYVHLRELGADKVVLLIAFWLRKWPLMFVLVDCDVSKETAWSYFRHFRIIARIIAWHDFFPIGGPGDIVEVDVVQIFRKTKNDDQLLQEICIFGGFSRTTKQCFGLIVPNGDPETLLPIMQKYIDCDSFICSERTFYECNVAFAGQCYGNRSKIHAFNPTSPTILCRHQSRVYKKSWREELKDVFKNCSSVENFAEHVGTWMYNQNILNRLPDFEEKCKRFCKDIARVYPGLGKIRMRVDIEGCDCHQCEPEEV